MIGHTHSQFDWQLGDLRLVNAGSVGMPYEDAPGAYWVLVRDGEPEHRRTEYDLEAAAERIRPTGWPIAERWVNENLLTVPTARDAAEFFEQQRARSTSGAESTPRVSRRRTERSGAARARRMPPRRVCGAVAVPGEPDQARRDAVAQVDGLDRGVALVDGQPRHDPDPDAGGDQALDGSVLVRAEHDVRVPAGLAEAILDALGRSARAVADQRLVDDLAQARLPVAGGERRSGRDDEDVGVAEELDGLVRSGRKREHDEAQVELAALDEQHELLVVGGLAQGDLDLRPVAS